MSVDLRTRLDAEQAPIHAGQFFRERLPYLFYASPALLAPGPRAAIEQGSRKRRAVTVTFDRNCEHARSRSHQTASAADD